MTFTDSFAVKVAPFQMMLLLEAIEAHYPAPFTFQFFENASGTKYVHVWHCNGYMVTNSIKDYIILNLPIEETIQ